MYLLVPVACEAAQFSLPRLALSIAGPHTLVNNKRHSFTFLFQPSSAATRCPACPRGVGAVPTVCWPPFVPRWRGALAAPAIMSHTIFLETALPS